MLSLIGIAAIWPLKAGHKVPKKKKFYREINVWERAREGRIAVYRCFEILPDGKYCVRSKDFFCDPIEGEAWLQSKKQALELLSEETPRRPFYGGLEEAIRRHDEDFAWAYSLEKVGDFKDPEVLVEKTAMPTDGVVSKECILDVATCTRGKAQNILTHSIGTPKVEPHAMEERELFREIDVWERCGKGGIAVYRCLEVLPDRKYCVQSKGVFHAPVQLESQMAFEKQFMEGLSREGPRGPLYDTLEEAIRRHEEDSSRTS